MGHANTKTGERWFEVDCDCGTELLRVGYWVDSPCLYLSMWESRYKRTFSGTYWRHRIRIAWHVLRHGDAYSDDMILCPQAARELVAGVQQFLDDVTPA